MEFSKEVLAEKIKPVIDKIIAASPPNPLLPPEQLQKKT